VRPRIRVVGVGHPDRGDDAAGLDVLDRIRARAPADMDIVRAASDGPALLAQIESLLHVVIVDCARGGGAPGAILRLDTASLAALPPAHRHSHGNALAEALALGEALGCLPARLTILAVVGERFGIGDAMSPAVRAALPSLASRALEEATCTNTG
jgi:hydrogenase maturation protease